MYDETCRTVIAYTGSSIFHADIVEFVESKYSLNSVIISLGWGIYI